MTNPLFSPALPNNAANLSNTAQNKAAKGDNANTTDGLSSERDALLKQRAKEFEAAFVAQMLKHGGLSEAISAESGFGGEAFASLMLEEVATSLADQGGFGLAENIYQQLRSKEINNGE